MLVTDKQTGLLFEQDSIDEVHWCMEQLYKNKDAMRDLGGNARRLMEENYSFPKIGKLYSTLYSELQ